MKILSLHIGHDSALAIFNNGKLIHYKMEERLSRIKNDCSLICILNELIKKNETNFDTIVIGRINLPFSEKYYKQIIPIIKNFKYDKLLYYEDDHHLFHAFYAFYRSNFDEALCISADGSGSMNDPISKKYFLPKYEGHNFFETESVFHFTKNNYEILYKRYNLGIKQSSSYKKFIAPEILPVNESNIGIEEYYDDNKIHLSSKISPGLIFEYTGLKNFGFKIFCAGKVMGLGQYKGYEDKLPFSYNTKKWIENVSLSNKIQTKSQERLINLIIKYKEKTKIKNVVISGGYGLNCVANYEYLKYIDASNLWIDPICFDAGQPLGLFYKHCFDKKEEIVKMDVVYIGHKEETYKLDGLNHKKVTYDDIANLLINQNIVALFQGRSEAGQRALGNRSLLFDSRIKNGRDIVNVIKKRESFRPFAGTILLEHVHDWFDMRGLKESPYMMFAVNCKEEKKDLIPAVLHVDGTCRLQTVTREQNLHFYNLIESFYKKTNIPMVLNTSFNLGGEPLVETLEHAIDTLRRSKIEYLYLPEVESLVYIENKK